MKKIDHQRLSYWANSDKKAWTRFAYYICECGGFAEKPVVDVNRGRVRSCGNCLGHGMSDTRFYRIWQIMKTRATNPNFVQAHIYSGRGITLCDHWHQFDNFYDDLHHSYLAHVEEFGEKNTQIDRIDVNGNYQPDNVRWVTAAEQQRNKRNNIFFEFENELLTIPEIAERTGIPKMTLYDRHYTGRPLCP